MHSFGGYVWTNGNPPQESRNPLLVNAFLAGGVGAGLYLGSRNLSSGYRPIDYIASYGKLGGHLSPFQLLSTFRLPEILSPFLSTKYRFQNSQTVSWDKDFLRSQSTYSWLKYTTNLSDAELYSRGIRPGMLGSSAASLMWTPSSGVGGRLETVFPSGERRFLADHIALLARNDETVNHFSQKEGINRFAAGVFAAADMHKQKYFNQDHVFRKGKLSASHIPIPSPVGPISSFQDLKARSTWLRGIPAFEMGRFNQLLENVSEHVLGKSGREAVKNLIGTGVKPGPASAMFARYGLLAAGAGALLIGNQELDWLRRKDLGGHLLAAGATSTGLAYAASKLGMTSKKASILGGISFASQLLLPGFDQSLLGGIATAGVNLDISRGSNLNPFNYYRRTLEGFLPGISDWETGALVGVGAILASSIRLPFSREKLNVHLAQSSKFRQLIGLPNNLVNDVIQQNKTARDLFYERIGSEFNISNFDTRSVTQRANLLKRFQSSKNPLEATRELNNFWDAAEQHVRTMKRSNPLNLHLIERLERLSANSQTGGLNTLKREGLGFMTEALMNFMGSDLSHDSRSLTQLKDLGFGKYLPTGKLGRFLSIGAAAFGVQQLLTGGLLGSMEDSETLKDIYSGKKLVEIKKGRFWEAGGTPFEGGQTSYFRPHAYALMMNRTREKGIWGEEEDEISPIKKFFLKNFTYELERRNYLSRPYPITNAAFQDVPIIGGFLASTIGSIIKPAKLMHASEWIRDNNGLEFAHTYKGDRREPAYSLGALGEGNPENPFSTKQLMAQYTNQFRELEGITGWAKDIVSGTLGTNNWGQEGPVLASANEMTSWNNLFWESETGGALFSNEFLRRILPHKRNKLYNPIANNMPTWLPDKFKYGDPYRWIQWGEARLPGGGYASLHPELKGIDPESYPLFYQYKILSDIAPLTSEFFLAQNNLYSARQRGELSQAQEAEIDRIDLVRAQQVARYSPGDNNRAIELPGSGITSSVWRGLLKTARHIAAPVEYLVPLGFRPTQKLLGNSRDIIEIYENERLYGTSLAMWDEPIRDWLRPSFYSAAHLLGFQGKPSWREEADQTNSQFDELALIKYMKLASEAKASGNNRDAARFRFLASQTRAGINPAQSSPLNIYWSLPENERAYFESFSQAKGSDRKRILEMIPEDEKQLYQSLWARIDAKDTSLYSPRAPIDTSYLDDRYYKALNTLTNLPEPDWIGWHRDVDLSDIQAKYIDSLGRDMHDYGLWEQDLAKAENQSFLEGSETPIGGIAMNNIRAEVYNMLGTSLQQPSISFSTYPGAQPYSSLEYNDPRDSALASKLNRIINGY